MPDPTPHRPRILSGMRPTGRLHLGNYMGALKNWVDLQNQRDPDGNPVYDCFFFIADWHALTTDYADPSRLKQNVFEVALDFLSAGLDPSRSTIFIQSHVPEHAELNLLLSMITPLSWLERIPTYKDQQEQLKEKDLATFGFLGYPLLQSADILLYRPHFVPVGQDQVAHVEITREIARRFNFLYPRDPEVRSASITGFTREEIRARGLEAEFLDQHPNAAADQGHNFRVGISAEKLWAPASITLPEPKALLTPSPKLPGTDGRKMSKSYGNSILLTDQPFEVQSKTKNMTNGGQRLHQWEPGDPEACPVGDLHRVFSTSEIDAKIRQGCRTASIGCIDCKFFLSVSINGHLDPIREKRFALEEDSNHVFEVLNEGAEKAAVCAGETMMLLRELTGLSRNHSGIRFEHSVNRVLSLAAPLVLDLKQQSEWWHLAKVDLSKALADYWFSHAVPVNAVLKEQGDRTFITSRGKRIFVTTSREETTGLFEFEAKPKSFEALALLCWDSKFQLFDLVIPQSVYVAQWSAYKKTYKGAAIPFSIRKTVDQFFFSIPYQGGPEIEVSKYRSDYGILL